jgi:hypothetical protein
MSARFHIGQSVRVHRFGFFGAPAGDYGVTAVMPAGLGGVPQYRVKSLTERHERVVEETAMTAAGSVAKS